MRLFHTRSSAPGCLFPALAGIIDPQCDRAHTVSMFCHMLRDERVRPERSGQHETHLPLLHNVGSSIAASSLGTRVSNKFHAESRAIKICGLSRVANVELHMVSAAERQEVFVRRGRCWCRCEGGTHAGLSIMRWN